MIHLGLQLLERIAKAAELQNRIAIAVMSNEQRAKLIHLGIMSGSLAGSPRPQSSSGGTEAKRSDSNK